MSMPLSSTNVRRSLPAGFGGTGRRGNPLLHPMDSLANGNKAKQNYPIYEDLGALFEDFGTGVI